MNEVQTSRRPGRDALRARTLAAARAILETEGLRAVTARRLAEACGYAVGTLYNLFETTDALIAELNLGTLEELDAALAADPPPEGATPEAAVLHVAEAALGFTARHRGRWAAVLDFVPAADHPHVAATAAATQRLVSHLDRALGPLGAALPEAERRVAAAVLWAGFEGIVGLSAAQKTAMVTPADAPAMIRSLVANYLAGLAATRRNGP